MRLQKHQLIMIVVGIICVFTAIYMVKSYIETQRALDIENAKKKLANMQSNQASVLVAKTDIPRGVEIDSKNLEVSIVPKKFIQPQAVTSLDRISGMVTIAPIAKNEQVTLSKLSYPQQRSRGLADATPVGKRAITITVDNISSLAGMVKAGDYVDIIAMVPVPVQNADGKQTTQAAVFPLFQNVLILAVGQDTGGISREEGSRYRKEDKKEAVSPLITLALKPQEASLIAFVQEQGRIRLVMRSPADSQVEPIQPASWDTLFKYIMPQAAEELPKQERPYVEIYRGLKKEKLLLSE